MEVWRSALEARFQREVRKKNKVRCNAQFLYVFVIAAVFCAAACSPRQVTIAQHNVTQAKLYAASLTTETSGTLHAIYLPKSVRSEKAIFAALIYERPKTSGGAPIEIEFGKQNGGYFTRTKLYDRPDKTLYFTVGNDDESDWMLGLRAKWRF